MASRGTTNYEDDDDGETAESYDAWYRRRTRATTRSGSGRAVYTCWRACARPDHFMVSTCRGVSLGCPPVGVSLS